MPLQYKPTDSRFLTVAQSRTNNGQKDIRIILDIQLNDFYSLDDDGNFNIIGGETLEQVLNAGNSTGGLSIVSPDGLTVVDIADANLNTQVIDVNYENVSLTQSSSYNHTIINQNDSSQCSLSFTPTNVTLQVVDVTNDNYSQLQLLSDSLVLAAAFDGGTDIGELQINSTLLYLRLNFDADIESKVQLSSTGVVINYDDVTNNVSNYIKLDNVGYYLHNVPKYTDDSDAAAGGLTTGYLYQTNGTGASPLDAAGIIMIKQ